jgi:cobalt/nickel transport system permease protein
MHLGNEAVTPTCALIGFGAAALAAGLAVWMSRRDPKRAPAPQPWHFAAATAAVFAMQMGDITVLAGQSSGHFMGGLLLAIWFGPAWGLLGITMVLAVQSVLFADGGLLVLGLNILNMGVVPCLLVYPLWRRVAGGWTGKAWWASAAVAAWASMVAAALFAAAQLLSQPSAAQQAGAVLGTMLGVHALIGLLEAGITLGMLGLARGMQRLAWPAAAGATLAALAAVVLLADRLASPFPDGLEFSLEILGLHGLSTAMIERVDALPAALAPWPDYSAVWGSLLACGLTGLLAALAVRLRANMVTTVATTVAKGAVRA